MECSLDKRQKKNIPHTYTTINARSHSVALIHRQVMHFCRWKCIVLVSVIKVLPHHSWAVIVDGLTSRPRDVGLLKKKKKIPFPISYSSFHVNIKQTVLKESVRVWLN